MYIYDGANAVLEITQNKGEVFVRELHSWEIMNLSEALPKVARGEQLNLRDADIFNLWMKHVPDAMDLLRAEEVNQIAKRGLIEVITEEGWAQPTT